MKIEEKIKNFIRSVHPSTWILFIAAMIVYSPFMVQQLNNADDNTYGYLYHLDPGYGVEKAMGRFLIEFFDMWRNSIITPVLVITASIIFLCIGAAFIIDMLDIKSGISKVIAGLLIICTPTIADQFTYYYVTDAYCFSFMLMTIAVWLFVKKKKVSNIVAGIILMICSLSMYQAYVGYAYLIIMVYAIKRLTEDRIRISRDEDNTEFIKVIRSVAGITAAMIAYLLLYKFLNFIGYLGYLKERRMDSIVGDTFSSLSDKIFGTYKTFFEYFFTNTLIYNSWFGRRYLNILVFILIIGLIAFLFIKNGVYKKWYNIIFLVLSIIMIPVFACFMALVAAGASIYAETGILMIPHVCLIYVLFVLLSDVFMESIKDREAVQNIAWIASRAVSVMILLIMIVFIEVIARYIDRQQSQITNLANRLVYRMETLEGYEEGQKVLVVGRPHLGNYSLPDSTYETITQGMISHYTQIFGAENQISEGWISAFGYFTGVFYTECTPDERKQLIASDEVQGMGIYPAENSVRKINDIVVIKLSDWTPENGR